MRKRTRGSICGVGALSTAALLGLASCYPGEIEDLEELDTVTTLFDPNEDFAANRTYALADSIVHLCTEIDADLECLTITRAFDEEILDQVEAEMDSLGYIRVSNPDSVNAPDLLVYLSVIAVQNTVLVASYPCWIWGWYYPCYYPPTWTAVEYDTGTFIITMVSPDRLSDDRRIPVVWTGVVNGVLSGSTADHRNRVLSGIGQAFEQSTYLDVEGAP